MKLNIVGSIALDSVATPFGSRTEVLGGSASYASVAASYFTEVGIVGVVGSDFPAEHTDLLARHKVDLTGLEIAEGETFRWVGRYEDNLSSAITVETRLNVFEDFVPKLHAAACQVPYCFLANIHPTLQRSVREQVNEQAFVLADTMNLWIEYNRDELYEVLEGLPMFTLNEGEARLLTGKYHLKEAAADLLARGPARLMIKRGEYGALLCAEGRWFQIPAILLDTVRDPTGAGDTFAGGFMGYLTATEDISFEGLREAIVLGTVMASFTVEGFSLDRLGALTRDDIIERYRELREFIIYPGEERLPW